MGPVRVHPVVAITTLAGLGLAGLSLTACATHPADQPDSTRLLWLAESLADELQAAAPDDPRLAAAAEPLAIIAGFANSDDPFVAQAFLFPAWLEAGAIDGLGEQSTPPALLAPLAPAALTPQAAPAPPMGLALGRFTNDAMAGALWREVQGIESAALTGLSGFTVREDHGVLLVAGPVDSAVAAEERCMALSMWGLSCVPTPWPTAAQAVPASEGAR